MKTNSKQKLVLLAFTVATVGMMLYPPFHITINGTEINMGYGPLFDPPNRGSLDASVNVPVLLSQWLTALFVSAAGWFLSRDSSNNQATVHRERNLENKKSAAEAISGDESGVGTYSEAVNEKSRLLGTRKLVSRLTSGGYGFASGFLVGASLSGSVLSDHNGAFAAEVAVRLIFGIVIGGLSFLPFLFVSEKTARKSTSYAFAVFLGYFLFHFIGQESESLLGIDENDVSADIASPDTSDLRKFLVEFVVNNENFHYPVKVSESTYLVSRSIMEKNSLLYVVENYEVVLPVSVADSEFVSLQRDFRKSAEISYCANLEEREGLFKGYSSVGSIINMKDAHGNQLVSIELSRSDCK